MSGCEGAWRCACGCPRRAHEHLRPGSDCGPCGRATCPLYRASTPASLLVPAACLAITGLWVATIGAVGVACGLPWWGAPLGVAAAVGVAALVATAVEEVREHHAARRAATANPLQVPAGAPGPVDLDDAAVLDALEASFWSQQARRDAARLRHPSTRNH